MYEAIDLQDMHEAYAQFQVTLLHCPVWLLWAPCGDVGLFWHTACIPRSMQNLAGPGVVLRAGCCVCSVTDLAG